MAALDFCFTMVFLSMTLMTSGVVSFQVNIRPSNIQTDVLYGNVTCDTEPIEPLSSCQFSVWYVDKQQPGAVLDVTLGEDTYVTVKNPYQPDTNYTAELYGAQFQNGSCAVRFKDLKVDQLLIGCKLTTTESNQSAINTIPYLKTNNQIQLYEHSATVFIKPGDSVNVALQAYNYLYERRLTSCTCTLVNQEKLDITSGYQRNTNNPNNPINLHNPNFMAVYKDNKRVTTDKHRYTLLEGRLGLGGCGFTINQVTERDNGVFFLVAHTQYKSVGVKAVTLVVAGEANPSVVMKLSKNTTEFDVGDEVTATCTASGVRLAATRWTWWWWNPTTKTYESITRSQDQSVLGWSWPWEETVVSQSLTLTLTREHDGLELACKVRDRGDPGRSAERREVITSKKTTLSAATTTTTSTTTTTPASEVSVAGRPVAPTTVATSTTTAPTTSVTDKADPGNNADNNMDFHVITLVLAALLAAVIILFVTACLVFACRKKLPCLRGGRDIPSDRQDPVYDEIHEAWALASLPPPSRPSRPDPRNLKHMAVPAQEEPECIIPVNPDDSANPDEYLQPIRRP